MQPDYDETISGTVSTSTKPKNLTAKKQNLGHQPSKQLVKPAHSSVVCSKKEEDVASLEIDQAISLKLSVHSEDALNLVAPGD